MHFLPEVTELVSGSIELNSELVRKPTELGRYVLMGGGSKGSSDEHGWTEMWGWGLSFLHLCILLLGAILAYHTGGLKCLLKCTTREPPEVRIGLRPGEG